jgi:hypothetical protein
MKLNNIIFVLVAVAVVGGSSALVRYIATRQEPVNPISSAVFVDHITDQQYVDLASKNCAKDGDITEAECRCMYSKMIQEYGRQYVYELDRSVTDDPNFQYPQKVIDIVISCI